MLTIVGRILELVQTFHPLMRHCGQRNGDLTVMHRSRCQDARNGNLTIRRINMQFEPVPRDRVPLAVPFCFPVTDGGQFRHQLGYGHGQLELDAGWLGKVFFPLFRTSPLLIRSLRCLRLLPGFLPSVNFCAVLRDMSKQVPGKSLPDQRFVGALGELLVRKLPKSTGESGFTRYLVPYLPPTYSPQNGVAQDAIPKVTGEGSIVCRLGEKCPRQCFPVENGSSEPIVVIDSRHHVSHFQNGCHFPVTSGERSPFFFQNRKQMPLNFRQKRRYALRANSFDISRLCCLFTAYNIPLIQGVSCLYLFLWLSFYCDCPGLLDYSVIAFIVQFAPPKAG